MANPDMDVIKEIPGYKVILKAVLKSQIQQLVEQLATSTEEESVILTASVSDGTLCHLGSDSGKVFLEDHEDIKSQFLGFCLKRHHKKKQEKDRQEAQEREEALARSMQTITPPRYDGMGNRMGYMPQHSPRYASPRQQGPPHPVAMSRASPGSRMRLPGNRHQPYPMARPPRAPLNFDQQGRSTGQGPGPSPRRTPVGNKLDGQVIKIEPEDDDDKSNQSASENTNVETDNKTNILESSQPSSPSVKPSTPSQSQAPSASDNEDAKSESSSSTIPNEASDLKLSDTNPVGGLSLDSDLSNIIAASSSVTESNVQQASTSQDSRSEFQTSEGFDPNISVKLEAGDSEMDLEITGVELGQGSVQEQMSSSQDWMTNVMEGATGSSDMSGQQGYKPMIDCNMTIDKTRYNPPTRPRVDRANYIEINEHSPLKKGYTRLAPDAKIAVESHWLNTAVCSVGPQKLETKSPYGSEILKRVIDGFFEPWELGVIGGSECFEGNIIYESLKCYARHALKMDLSTFRRLWNQKMGTSRRTVKRLKWKNQVDSYNETVP